MARLKWLITESGSHWEVLRDERPYDALADSEEEALDIVRRIDGFGTVVTVEYADGYRQRVTL